MALSLAAVAAVATSLDKDQEDGAEEEDKDEVGATCA